MTDMHLQQDATHSISSGKVIYHACFYISYMGYMAAMIFKMLTMSGETGQPTNDLEEGCISLCRSGTC
jgi:hypothetical protein